MEAGTMAPPASSTSNGNGNGPEYPEVPLEGEGDDAVDTHDAVVIPGDGQLSLVVGGDKPTASKILIRGGQIPFEGQMRKGDRVTITMELRCAEVHLIDSIDSTTREVTQTTRKHVLKVESASKVGEEAWR